MFGFFLVGSVLLHEQIYVYNIHNIYYIRIYWHFIYIYIYIYTYNAKSRVQNINNIKSRSNKQEVNVEL